MGYQVALSPSACRDLRDIVRYISLVSPQRAVSFGEFLVSNTKRLADFPEMGHVVPEFDNPAIREIVVRSYRLGSITATAASTCFAFGMAHVELPRKAKKGSFRNSL